MTIVELIEIIKNYLSFIFVIPMVFFMGCYLSYCLNFIQLRKIKEALTLITQKSKTQKNNISAFSALAAVLGGNLGTGNIAGVAIALSLGGPGSLFWMWVMALLGAVIKFFGTYLGVLYRQENQNPIGQYIGGPMYYIESCLKRKNLAKIYAFSLICAALLVGNMVQINSISLPLQNLEINPILSSLFLSVIVACLLFSRGNIIINFISLIVPFMAVLYIFSCLIILTLNAKIIPIAIIEIFNSAFDFSSILSGGASYTMLTAIKLGFDRGLFATDAGIGLAPILHSQVNLNSENKKEEAFKQGLISMLAPLIVMIICTITGLVLMVTGVWKNPCLESTNQCIEAFTLGLQNSKGGSIIVITLTLFALTTILTWFHCAEHALYYLTKDRYQKWAIFFKIIFIIFIPAGMFLKVKLLWSLADIALNLMLILNIYALFHLAKQHLKSIRNKI